MNKPKVGDKLFSLNVGNAARNREQLLTKVTVCMVGRKYFTTHEDGREKFEHLNKRYYIDSWREKTDYSTESYLYRTEKEWADKEEISKIAEYISSRINYNRWHVRISVEDAREIKSILDKYNES